MKLKTDLPQLTADQVVFFQNLLETWQKRAAEILKTLPKKKTQGRFRAEFKLGVPLGGVSEDWNDYYVKVLLFPPKKRTAFMCFYFGTEGVNISNYAAESYSSFSIQLKTSHAEYALFAQTNTYHTRTGYDEALKLLKILAKSHQQ